MRWWTLANVQIGGAICLPVILVGFELARLYGFSASIGGIVIGNGLLACLATLCSEMTWTNKLTTAENAGLYFGPWGKRVVAVILSISMCSWFAVQTQVVAEDIGALPIDRLRFVLAAFFAGTLLFGFKGITRLADLALPMMVTTLAIVLVSAYWNQASSIHFDIWQSVNLHAISLVMAVAIGVCLDMPTFFRNAASKKDSHLGTWVTFIVGIPLVELCGVLLYQWSGYESLMQAFRQPTFMYWEFWITIFFFFAAWTTNTCNLYSAAMGLSGLIPHWKEKKLFIVTAVSACILTQIDFLSHLSQVLDILGIVLAASFGTIVSIYITKRALPESGKMASLLLGICGGLFTTFFELKLPFGIAVLDSACIAAVAIYSIGRGYVLVAR